MVRSSQRKPLDGGILVEVGAPRWPHRRGRQIVEIEPPRRLVIRWQDQIRPELKAEGESHCTMELESHGPAAKLSIALTIEREHSNLCVGVQLLAKGHLQPEVLARERLCRSGCPPSR